MRPPGALRAHGYAAPRAASTRGAATAGELPQLVQPPHLPPLKGEGVINPE